MQYRTLGKTGLKVSVLAYGGSSLASVFRTVDESEGIRSVHLALDHGINLFDTAPYYGATSAETVLGKALEGLSRDQYLLATKVARYGPRAQDFDFSYERVLKGLDESLIRLGVEYVDLIQVHDIEFGHIPQIINETIPALRTAQEAGKARFVGITGLHLKSILRVIREVDVDQVQSYCHYCLNDDALLNLIPDLQSRGIGIFNSAPLGMRLLTNEGPPDWHPAPAELRRKCIEAAQYCREHGCDLGRLALKYAVSEPSIHTTVIGTASPERVVQNIREAAQPLNRDILAKVLEILHPVHNVTWESGIVENGD